MGMGAPRDSETKAAEVEGPSLAITTNLSKKAKGGIIEVTRRGVFGVGLEELHLASLAPKDRVSNDRKVLLRRLELLLCCSPERV